MDVIIKTSTEPPSHQRPVETLSENDINHDIEPAYHRMHASIVHPEESPTEASERANAIEEQPNGESQPIEIMPEVHPQPQEMPQIVLQLPPQPEPEPTQQSASDLHETSSEHTGVEDERYKEQQKQHVETTEEDIPDDSRVDAPPTFTRTSAAEREMLLSCAEASETMQPCHTHARCIDYHPGYCCECLHGYYGNGKECLKSEVSRAGDPQRINGGFEGVINGEAIGRTELHTYVMTAEGRAYTALSQIPPHHGRSLLLLNPIGGAMGWLFAKVESPSSYNGFQLTGGLFNRTVNVHIGDRSAVTIKQQFSGRDIYHYFKAQIFVTGTLPQLAENVEVIYPDHEEEYRREGPGFVRSYSAHDVLVKENGHERTMRLTIDQQIHYKECPYKAFDKDSVVVLRVSRPHVIYDAEERIVRYASANSATNERSLNLVEAAVPEPQEPSRTRSQQPVQKSKDPCGQGNHVCTLPNMFCTAVEPSYRCECERGFQAQPDASTHLGWKCIDLDECQRGDHTCDQNAICANTDGGFNCECRPGYQGDGHRCHTIKNVTNGVNVLLVATVKQATVGAEVGTSVMEYIIAAHQTTIPREDTSTASECHSHQECHQWGECAFGRNGEAGYCRCRGWYVGDGVHHCGPPDEQPRLAVTEMPQRQENTGNLCGGYICDSNADCMPAPRGGDECVCRSGFHGNGVQCAPHAETMRPIVYPVGLGSICRAHDECGEHGNCVYGTDVGYYRCVCVPPYRSDGIQCVKDETADVGPEIASCDIVNTCDVNGDCVFEKGPKDEGYYRCRCRPGFTGDGLRCVQTSIDNIPFITCALCAASIVCLLVQCELFTVSRLGSWPSYCDTLNNCGDNAECVHDTQSGHYICKCIDGFDGDGYSCIPIYRHTPSELSHPSDVRQTCREATDCHRNAHCVVRENSFEYYCECLPGFKGDGVNVCKSADECTPTDAHSCHEHAECVYGQVEGAYICKCVQGFAGDGRMCTPHARPSTCDVEPTVCHVNAQCVYNHDENRHICICKPGSVGDGYVNCEIQETPRCGRCSAHASCVQRDSGAWECECNPGYQGNGHQVVSTIVQFAILMRNVFPESMDTMFAIVTTDITAMDAPAYVIYTLLKLSISFAENRSSHILSLFSYASTFQFPHKIVARLFGRLMHCIRLVGIVIPTRIIEIKNWLHSHRFFSFKWIISADSENREEVLLIGRGMTVIQRGTNPEIYGKQVINSTVAFFIASCLDDRSICDPNAECVPGEHGYYVCNCHYGYHGNGRTCLPDSENREEVLLIGRGMTVIQRGTNPEIYGKQLVVIPHQIVVGLDFDCQEERIVWSDISGHALRSASLNGTDEKKFMESVLQSPEGIAIDWSSRNVYYADSVKDEIGVASLDGKYQKTLINEGLVNPRALAIDLRNRHLYYSDWHRENPLIGRVDLDGRNNIPFVNNELYLPNGLTVLEERRELCWVDAGMQRLSCIGLDGRNRRVVFAPLEYPFGLTTHNEQRFYWTDWKDNQIHSVSIYGDGYLSFPATIGGSGRLYGIASVPLQCKGTPTACAVNNGGCQYMCLPGTTQVRCACPDNIEDLEGC
uniref:Nidogen n=1 Tax=Ascaris lumbricoides TaxID=6252 RepID=A0A9J2PVJ1_ASCLU